MQGYVTTLKRNGSDYSATILGALFAAGHITIWTDVNGVYSADPRKASTLSYLQQFLQQSEFVCRCGLSGHAPQGSAVPRPVQPAVLSAGRQCAASCILSPLWGPAAAGLGIHGALATKPQSGFWQTSS